MNPDYQNDQPQGNPYGYGQQNQYGQNQYGQNQYGQNQYAQNPYCLPYQQNPYQSYGVLPGSSMIQISSIIIVILAVLGIIGAILLLVGSMAVGSMSDALPELYNEIPVRGMAGIVGILSVFMLIPPILSLITGILGLKHHNNPTKAKTLLVWGIIILIFQIINFLATVSTSKNTMAIIVTLLSLSVALIYVLGAIRNKKYQQ